MKRKAVNFIPQSVFHPILYGIEIPLRKGPAPLEEITRSDQDGALPESDDKLNFEDENSLNLLSLRAKWFGKRFEYSQRF